MATPCGNNSSSSGTNTGTTCRAARGCGEFSFFLSLSLSVCLSLCLPTKPRLLLLLLLLLCCALLGILVVPPSAPSATYASAFWRCLVTKSPNCSSFIENAKLACSVAPSLHSLANSLLGYRKLTFIFNRRGSEITTTSSDDDEHQLIISFSFSRKMRIN